MAAILLPVRKLPSAEAPFCCVKLTKWIWKQQIFELPRLLPNMEIIFIYGIVLRLRLPTAVAP